jgi:membrane associated rhomboid family serine protease
MDPRRMCPHCRAFITNKDRVCPYCNEKVGARAVDRRSPGDLLGGLIPHARFVTTTISTLNVGMFLLTVIYSMRSGAGGLMGVDGRTLAYFGDKFPAAIQLGQWWRLVTAGYLHGGLFHIFMNSWVLLDVGAIVEEVYGPSRMFVFYTLANIGGFYLSYLWSPVPSMGASAAIMGLIGAMIAFGMQHRSAIGDAIKGQYIRWVIWILIIGLLPGFSIDNAAHIGGLVVGFCVGYLAGTPRFEGSPVETMWKVAAGFSVLLTAVCFLEMYLSFSRFTQ